MGRSPSRRMAGFSRSSVSAGTGRNQMPYIKASIRYDWLGVLLLATTERDKYPLNADRIHVRSLSR
jgi:hypothetical protein